MTLNQPKKSLCGAGLFSGKGESLATALHNGARAIWSAPAELSATTALSIRRPAWSAGILPNATNFLISFEPAIFYERGRASLSK